VEGDRGGTLFKQGRNPVLDDNPVVADPGFDRQREKASVRHRIDAGPAAIGALKCGDGTWADAQLFETLSIVPVFQTLPRRLDDCTRQLRLTDQRCAATGGGNFSCRAAHIDVQSVKAKLAYDMSDFVE
jgi:hypothetical protein